MDLSPHSRSSRAGSWCGGSKAEEESDPGVGSALTTTRLTLCQGAAQQSMGWGERS